MDMEITKSELEQVIRRCKWLNLSENERPETILDLRIEDAVAKGFNYSGRLLRLKAKTRFSSGKVDNISLVLKLTPTSQDQCDFMKEHGLFSTETMTYDHVLSKMEVLMADSGITRDMDWPKHYTIDREKSLLLEDLKASCYSTIRQRQASEAEAIKVVEALGRFHAMSRVLADRGDIDIDKYRVNNMAENNTIIEFVYFSSIRGVIDAIRSTNFTKWFPIVDWIEPRLSYIRPELNGLVNKRRGIYDVLNHGDCWPNNIMFQYLITNDVPSAIKLIDFQLCYYNSFAWDLVHFIYCSFLPDRREKLKNSLVEKYQNALKESLRIFKCDDLSVPSIEEILSEMEEIKLFGTLVGLATIPRLIEDINIELDLDITLPDHAHKAKTAVYSMPQVIQQVQEDLGTLYNLMKKMK